MAVAIPRTRGLSEEEIDAAEDTLGCKLPLPFREFIVLHDGAKPSENIFDAAEDQISVRAFIPLKRSATLRRSIEGFPPSAVPVAEDDCGNYVFLAPDTGAIHFWDHESDDQSIMIAPDFQTFIADLNPFDASSLPQVKVRRVWVDPSFKPKFD